MISKVLPGSVIRAVELLVVYCCVLSIGAAMPYGRHKMNKKNAFTCIALRNGHTDKSICTVRFRSRDELFTSYKLASRRAGSDHEPKFDKTARHDSSP